MADIFIDPIVVRETQERLSTAIKDIERGTSAADALLWFSAVLKTRTNPSNMFSLNVITNGSEVGTKAAGHLLTRAAQYFHTAILEKAVEIAHAELKAAEKARKEGAQ